MATVPDPTQRQENLLSITERVGSCLSLAGIAFIFATFTLSPYFKKSINRQIFYASIGNLGVTVAALISEDGPRAGQYSALCQFQGFLVQMFLGVDCFWSLCMAVNVYLIFFHKYTLQQLRILDWKYLIGCYGASFVPAFVYIFVDTKSRGKVYGPAIIWCWVTSKWDPLRIALLYGIVWVAIVLAFSIYCMAGKVLWRKRKELPGFLNPLNECPFKNTITTEIIVTSRPRPPRGLSESSRTSAKVTSPPHLYRGFSNGSKHTVLTKPNRTRGFSDSSHLSAKLDKIADSNIDDDFDPYSVNVEAGKSEGQRRPSLPDLMRIRTLTRTAAVNEMNAEAWLYARTSFLFFLALLITWVPTSINRVYAIAHPTHMNFGLNYASSLVFPLQGFWNVLVYIITSQTACKRLWAHIRGLPPPPLPDRDIITETESKQDVKLNRIARRESHRLDSDATSVSTLK